MFAFYRNQYDSNKSGEIGDTAEKKFIKAAESRGWTVVQATQKENMIDHIDFFLHKDNICISVDVKSKKRIKRHDTEHTTKWIWVELKNVNGNKGWLYGKANMIAFDTDEDFVIVPRLKLKELVESLNITRVAKTSDDAYYGLYTRNGRKDLCTMIEYKHLYSIIWEGWDDETKNKTLPD